MGRSRNIGFSPQYALLTASGANQFLSDNTFAAGSTLTIDDTVVVAISGDTTFAASSSTTFTGPLTVSTPTLAGHPVRKDYLELRLVKTSTNAAHYLDINATGNLVLPVAVDAGGSGLQAATKSYVDTGLALKVNLAGTNTLVGALTVITPTTDYHAATKLYVDTGLALKVNLAGANTLTGALTLSGAPTLDLHAATKLYVDSALGSKTAGVGLAAAGDEILIVSSTLNPQVGSLNLLSIHTGGVFSGGGTYNAPTWYVASKVDSYGRVTAGSTNLDDALDTTTLAFAAGTLNLSIINSGGGGWAADASSYSSSTFYDRIKVDGYGRVVSGVADPAISATDGWYNSIRVQDNRITQTDNVVYLIGSSPLPLAASTSGDLTVTSATGVPSDGIATTTLTYNLKTQPGLAAGTYSKVTLNGKGIVTAASELTSSDIETALGYLPPSDSNVSTIRYKSSFVSNSWGTQPISTYTAFSGAISGASISGSPQRIYLPIGIYYIKFGGSNNWYSTYSSDAVALDAWWANYWPRYYEPACIYVNGSQILAGPASDSSRAYTNASVYSSGIAEDFSLSDIVTISGTSDYVQFGLPMLQGITFWYDIKIVKLK